MTNGSIELVDSLKILQEELPEFMAKGSKKKSIEKEQKEEEEKGEDEPNYNELFYGNYFDFLLISYNFY